MKHLQEYVYWFFEDNENTELRKQIIDYVDPNRKNDKGKKDINDITDETLKKAYQVLQSLSKEDFDKLKNEVFKNNLEGFKELAHLLEKTGNKINMMQALLHKHEGKCFSTFEDLKNNSGKKNLFDVILNDKFIEIYGDKEEAKHFLEELIKIKYKDANDKGVGRGELYLFSLFKNTANAKRGDVQIDGHDIEVKFSTSNSSNGGKLKASKLNLKSPQDMIKFLKDKYDISNVKLGGPTIMHKTIENISDNIKDGFDKLLECILYQFPFYDEKNLKILKDFINKIGIDEKNIGSQIIRIHGCLALIEYHRIDKWEYLLVGNSSNGNYYLIPGENCDINKLYESLNFLYSNTNFVFKDGPMTTEGASERNYVSSIYVSTKDNIYNN